MLAPEWSHATPSQSAFAGDRFRALARDARPAMAVGALVGWALGGAGLGLLIGAVLGIPLAVFVVYRVYSRQP